MVATLLPKIHVRHMWWGLVKCAFVASVKSSSLFCVRAFSRNLASVIMKMFSLIMYFLKTFYKLYFNCDLQR
jgi:hypothetical protein